MLFFGVAFLLKYFAEHFTVPIELRLAAVAAGGFVLIGLGLRLAGARPGYGLSLQGAGAGVLYLTTYAAFQLYGVLPEPLAIALLVAVSALTVWLAVRNDSQPLAGLAVAGGFVAPLLVATGSDPMLLFGYFALLNGAIFTLAWTKAWRALNAVGFLFTFVLGAVWGHGYYRPGHFAVVEPFLVLFFAFYVAIAILYARRRPPAAKDPVDGLLVFGVPLVGFALQAALVRDARYGAAWSAVALAAIYALLGLALRKRSEPGFALLARAFLALAVIFVTIAIPFALDSRETAALWAIEAAGVYWIGVRQRSRLARAFALLVEIGAGIVFAVSGVGGEDDPLFANAFFAGAMLIALSGLVTARVADAAGDALPAGERGLVPLVFGWGALWWLAAGGVELVRQLPRAQEAHAILAWVTAGVALALALRHRLAWPRLAGAGIALLPTMGVAALGDFDFARTTLTVYGWIVWPCAWLAHWQVLRAADETRADLPPTVPPMAKARGVLDTVHAFSALALTVQLAWEASEWTGRFTPPYTAWTPCAAALPPIAFLWLAARLRDSTRWPRLPHGHAYAIGAGVPIAALLCVWFVMVNVLSPGDASPLPYLPLASPLDLTLALALWVLASMGSPVHCASGARALSLDRRRVVRRAERDRRADRAPLGRHTVAARIDADVEAAAGGADAHVERHRAFADGRRDEATAAAVVDARSGTARGGRRQAVSRRSRRAVGAAARRGFPRCRNPAARDRLPVAAAARGKERRAARGRQLERVGWRGRAASRRKGRPTLC